MPNNINSLQIAAIVVTYNRKELFIHILAHELRHIWQAKHKRGWRVWGSRGQFSERDADAYAIHKVREYRRNERI